MLEDRDRIILFSAQIMALVNQDTTKALLK